MRAGKLRNRITIEQKTETIDALGDAVNTWATVKTVWAEVLNQSGREFISAREQNSELTHLITIRYLSGVNSKMRVNHGGNYYNILSVIDPNSRKSDLRLFCSEQL